MGPFNDEHESPFYEAEDYSPERTWEKIAEGVAGVTARAVALALLAEPASAAMIADFHRRIFGELFPEVAGRLRRRGEEVQYGILMGTRKEPVHRARTGTAAGSLGKRLKKACDEFNAATAVEDESEEEPTMAQLIAPAVKFYAKVLSIHPFMDGNGRTAYVLLQYALVRNYLLAVALTDYERHQWALGVALRDDRRQSYVELEALVADTIGNAEFDPG